jgi:hypothetical protein
MINNELLNNQGLKEILEILIVGIIGGSLGGMALYSLDYASTFSKRMGEKMDMRKSKQKKAGDFS